MKLTLPRMQPEMFVTQLSRIIPKTSSRTTTSTMSSSASSSYATSPDETLSSLSTALQLSAQRAVDALKSFIVKFPAPRQELQTLEERLERLSRSARVFSDGERDLGEDVVSVLRRVVSNARVLVDEEVCGVVTSEADRSRSSSEHVIERLQPVSRIVESVGLTLAFAVGFLEL
jgi:DNA repair ATPase RecN